MSKTKLSVLSVISASLLSLVACTNPTSTAGSQAYFTEGIVKDVEIIDINENKYDTKKNAGLGATGGAILGQIIGGNTKGTLIGAGIGAVLGGGASMMGNSSDGMRLTVKTSSGMKIVDTVHSCLIQKNSKVRLIQQRSEIQVQVLTTAGYRTAKADPISKCPR